MSREHMSGAAIEFERYELYANDAIPPGWSRRHFFQIAGSGLAVALLCSEGLAQQQPRRRGGRRSGGAVPQELAAWLHIGEDSVVTVFTGKTEMGQNIRTSLTQVVAEELNIAPERIKLVMADTQLTPFDGGTAGSRTTPSMAPQLRRAATTAREALLDMAAEATKGDRSDFKVRDGKVIDTQSKKELTFGELTKGKKLAKVIGPEVAVAPPGQWKTAGRSIPKVDGRAYVTGRHKYTSDIKRPGMLFGRVLRPQAFKATLVSAKTTEAEKRPDVKVVRDGEFIGVVAATQHAADCAVGAIKAEWKNVPQPSGKELFKHLKERASAARGGGGGGRFGPSRQERGSIDEGMNAADHQISTSYTIAYIAHAPLEPRAAVAEWDDGKLTVWTGTQRPFGVRDELAAALGISADKVRVIVPDTGAGYGGKHSGEAAIEAARLAKGAGKPVKLVWTREEEFTWAYFRPAGVIEITAGAKRDGKLTAWECHNYNSGGSGLESPYDVPNQRQEFHATDSPLRQGSYRALASTANHFARESHMDDLAHVVQLDPLEFRLRNLKNERIRAVLEAAAKGFGWGKSKAPADRGFGIAGGTEKGSYVATCAEVAVDAAKGDVRVQRLVTAFECGAVINPDQLKNQIEGAAVMGLGGALFEFIDFDNGKILNPHFSRYRVPRFGDVPSIETVLVDRRDLPSAGAGETPIVAVAPAIGNAIFAACKTRLRALPLVPNGLQAAPTEKSAD